MRVTIGVRLGRVVPDAVGAGLALGAWGYFVWMPGRRAADWIFAEAFLILALLFVLCLIVSPAQYAAAALGAPWPIRGSLQPTRPSACMYRRWCLWTRTLPWLVDLSWSYASLQPQLFLPVLVLGFWSRDRAALWEYAFHFRFAGGRRARLLRALPACCSRSLEPVTTANGSSRVAACAPR